MPKLLCFDLDGTLLCDDKSISTQNKNALHQALKNGHSLAIVTGRSARGSRMIVDALEFHQKNCYLISFQGNLIYDLYDNHLVYEAGVEKDFIIALLNDLNQHNIYAHTFDYKHIITNQSTDELKKYNEIAKEDVTFVVNWENLNAPTYPKIIAINYENQNILQEYANSFSHSEFAKDFDCFFSSPYFLEFCKKDSNKGTGVKALASYLHFSPDDIVAMGDERNDIPMIQYAGMGCAMANAHPDLLKTADYITQRNNNESAIAEIIEKYML